MRLPVDARYGCLLHDPESWSGWQRQVGVVQPGPITAPAYRTILASSELPPVIEGQESVGEMLALGRPFLQLRRPERVVGYRYVDIQPDAPFSSWLDALALDLSRAGDAAGAPGDGAAAVVEKLAGLLLRCHSGDEEIRRFFAGLAHQDRLDKLETALAALALLLEQERIGALTIQKE